MLRKLASLVLVTALVCALSGTSAFANTASGPDSKAKTVTTSSEPGTLDAKEPKTNEKLRADVRKLVDDARAGKVAPVAKSQIQPARSNNWSTGTKVAVGVGIAVAVIAVIVIVNADKGPDSIRIF